MSRFLQGAVIILFIVVLQFVVGTVSALYTTGVGPDGETFTNCEETDNVTECNDVGQTVFLAEVLRASILPFTGEGAFVGFLNAIYLLILGFLLVVGVILIVVSFIPTTSA